MPTMMTVLLITLMMTEVMIDPLMTAMGNILTLCMTSLEAAVIIPHERPFPLVITNSTPQGHPNSKLACRRIPLGRKWLPVRGSKPCPPKAASGDGVLSAARLLRCFL